MASCNCQTGVNYADYYSDNIYTWCTNCGNYGIEAALKRALVDKHIHPRDVLLSFDIGCHGNGSDKLGGYRFHGLHGRVIPFASGAALANKEITVIASGGDGGTLSEGIGHLVHAIRSNYNFTFILHNNSNYGLTTGQASSTTKQDVSMNSSPDGVTADTMNVMEFVLSLNPSFAARSFSGNVKHMTEVFKAGIDHKGFSFIEIMQDCPTYNKETPHKWYMDRVYDVSEVKNYDNADIRKAKDIAEELEEKIAIGVLYQDKSRKSFYDRQKNREGVETELVDEVKGHSIERLLKKFM